MRILMVGAGATGGFYGGLLSLAGRDVTFLLRARRAEQIREHGLEIVLHTGQRHTLHPPVVTATDLGNAREPFDLIVISTKAYQLAAAMDDIAPSVGPDTMILPILNGMQQLSLLQKRFGAQHVLGGTVRVVADMDQQGRVLQMNALDEMSYGELSAERTDRIEAVDREMKGVGFTAILQPDIVATLWQKWWILASMGTICILARGTIGQAATVPYGQALARTVLDECTATAAANGYPPNPAMLQEHLERITQPSSTMTTSLYRDLCKGAPLEADQILGDLIKHAQAHGIVVPLLTAAYVQLQVYQAQRRPVPSPSSHDSTA